MRLRPDHRAFGRCRTLLLGAGLLVFAAAPSLAQDNTLASDTMRVCEANPDFNQMARDQLDALGWRALEETEYEVFAARLGDAALVSSRHLLEPVDWDAAPAEAQSMAEGLLLVDDPTLLILLMQPDAALAVVNLSDDDAFITRCVYGGPSDAEQAMVFDTVARADDGVGITQGDPHLHSYSMQNTWIEGDTELEMSLHAARYLPTATEQLGRPPSIAMGFSLIAIAEK